MGKIIALANQKGGVGKTTSAVNIAAAVGAMGHRVLLVDMDPQGNTSSGVGINKTRMKAGDVTFGSIRTENGKILAFAAEGEFTDDPIEDAFFGSGKVVYKKGMDGIANYMANNGYKHHLCVTHGKIAAIVLEAFTKYLGYETDLL